MAMAGAGAGVGPRKNLSDDINNFLNGSDPYNKAARARPYTYYLPGSEKEAKAKAIAVAKAKLGKKK